MIRGIVNRNLDAVVSLLVSGPASNSRIVEAVIDTGFNGQLILVSELIQELGLKRVGTNEGILADGTKVDFEMFIATISWHGEDRAVAVLQSDGGTLAGMSLLEGSRLAIDVAENGPVIVESLLS